MKKTIQDELHYDEQIKKAHDKNSKDSLYLIVVYGMSIMILQVFMFLG